MKKIAIDLTWVRHGKVGGTESCVRNLLKGIQLLHDTSIKIYLILAQDNADFFKGYDGECFEKNIVSVNSSSQKDRVIWQNLKLGKILIANNIDVLLEPIYSTPFLGMHGIKVYTTIHDLQAIHYPEYFSRPRVVWMKLNWKHSVKSAYRVIAISNYVRDDIIEKLKANPDKVITIYDSIELNHEECTNDENLKKYNVSKGQYYYTVSSLLPHKNLITLIKAVSILKDRKSVALYPLVISGVGGKSQAELDSLIKDKNLEDLIIFTPFVENDERNMLYKNCKAFLFPSVFEGFGMPPLEAMAMGVPVLTTKCTSLEEVTGRLLNYVDNPMDPVEWADKLEKNLQVPSKENVGQILGNYSCKQIAEQYMALMK